jgi:hypothetical protein
MRVTSSLLSALTLSSSLVIASPTKSEAIMFHEIDLEAFETGLSNKTLTERKQVKVCGKTLVIPSFDRCLASTSLAGTIGLGVAGLLYSKSSNNDCSAEELDTPDYQYAVRTTGKCHTTAQRTTIEGALDHYIDEEMPPNVCGVHCLKLTDGGNWQGYVVFGVGNYNWEKYLDQCAQVGKLGHCESGGKKYIHG